jgi:tRNA1(Val) A37 N6-methylase TrmN6
MFDDHDLTADRFLGGRLVILQPRDGYRAAMDPVLLAAAVAARPGDRVLDIGCGAGVAGLCLGRRVPGVLLTGLEVQADYAALAGRNAAANGIAMNVLTGDIAQPPGALTALSFDHVMMNPPYFAPQDGTAARDPGRERAQRVATPLELWLTLAARRLRPGGWVTLIQTTERLRDVLAALPPALGSVSILPLAPRAGRPAHRFVLRARKGGRAALRMAAPLVLHDGPAHLRDGDDASAAGNAILREAAALTF